MTMTASTPLPREILGGRNDRVPGRLIALGRERANADGARDEAHARIHDRPFERDLVFRERNDEADGGLL
jgi:hypothetical protein